MGNVNAIRVCIQIHSIFHLTKQHKIGYYILYYQSVQGAMIWSSLCFRPSIKYVICHMPPVNDALGN